MRESKTSSARPRRGRSFVASAAAVRTRPQLLIDALRVALDESGSGNFVLLDVGAGLGAIHHALLDGRVTQAVHIDASTAQLAVAREETARRPVSSPALGGAAESAATTAVARRRDVQRLVRWSTAATVAVSFLAAGWWISTKRAGSSRIESLVVLPLENLTGDSAQAYFVDGMHEALTAELSQISALKVISRTSAMRYRNSGKPAPRIARELGVTGLVEGSVARDGDSVPITVQLIHGPTDRRLWGHPFTRELRGVLTLHTEVARAIAEEIKTTVTPREQVRLSADRLVNAMALEAYLLGRHLWNQRTLRRTRDAIQHFRLS